MNLMGAILVNLWVAGWVIAAVRAGLEGKGRRGGRSAPARDAVRFWRHEQRTTRTT